MADGDEMLVLGRGGVSLEDLIRVLDEIEGQGALEEFLQWSPRYIVDVELLRTLLQRGQGNINRAGPQERAGPVAALTSPPFPNFPSASSVRYFVGIIAQLLEEQCPMRQGPTTLVCEDRCLAALQIAIHECLKTVRQLRQNGPGGAPRSPETPCSRNNDTANYSPPPPLSPGSPCSRAGSTPPPPQSCGRSRPETPRQFGGPSSSQQGQCSRKPQPSCGATNLTPPPACNATQGCSRPETEPRSSPLPGPSQPKSRAPSCGTNVNIEESSCGRSNQRASYPPTKFAPNFRLDAGHNATIELAKLLDAIPVPPPCPYRPLTFETKCAPKTCGIQQTKESESNQPGKSRINHFYPPVAGQYSDGMGGGKIKDFPYDGSGKNQATYDGMGSSKPKGIED